MEVVRNPDMQDITSRDPLGHLNENHPTQIKENDCNLNLEETSDKHGGDIMTSIQFTEDSLYRQNIDKSSNMQMDTGGGENSVTSIMCRTSGNALATGAEDTVQIDDDDLEDGEIETDDDEPVITAVIPPESNKELKIKMQSSLTPMKTNISLMGGSSDIHTASTTGNEMLKFEKEVLPASSSKKNKFRRMEIVDDDWAGNIESAIAAALKKDGIEPPMPKIEKRSANSNLDHFDKNDSIDEVKRSRKRKKRDDKDKAKLKRMKNLGGEHHGIKLDAADEIDEDEMMCVRGGSPTPMPSAGGLMHHMPMGLRSRRSPSPHSGIYNDSEDSYQSSYESYDSAENRKMTYEERRQLRRNKDRRNRVGSGQAGGSGGRGGAGGKRRNRHESDGDDCPRSHDARPPRKLELCKFYLMDCCAKKDKCSYMHADFPCKYYYLGMECVYKSDCKFSHGDPLTEQLKNILLKHIETAPKEILGNFRRISRENATNLLLSTHAKLCADKGVENTLEMQSTSASQPFSRQSRSPSVNRGAGGSTSLPQPFIRKSHSPVDNRSSNPFASSAPPPLPASNEDEENWDNEDWDKPGSSNVNPNSSPVNSSAFSGTKSGEKPRKSRWRDYMATQVGSATNSQSSDILSLKNLKGVITPEQIKRLENIGIENLEQISQLTVAQLNSVGLTIGQINEIQLNAMNIQKLGLISSQNSSTAPITSPVAANQNTMNSSHSSNAYNDDSQSVQDVDMRCLVGAVQASGTSSSQSILSASQITESSAISATVGSQPSQLSEIDIASPEPVPNLSKVIRTNADSMDFSQYLKDSNVKDADDTDFNDLLKEDKDDDDALNEDEPELLIDESRCAGSDEETEANSEDTFSLSKEKVSSKVFATKGEDDDDWDDDNATPSTSSTAQPNATISSSYLNDDDWQEETNTDTWPSSSNNRSVPNKNSDWQDDNNTGRGNNNRWKAKNKNNESWQDRNKNDSWVDKSKNDSWADKNKNESWADKNKNESWADKNKNESWADKNKNESWADKNKNESWADKNKNESWADKNKNDSWADKRTEPWQEKNRNDSWQDKSKNEPWKEKNRNDSWQQKGRNDSWPPKSDNTWQENGDSWQQKNTSPDFYRPGDQSGDFYSSGGNASRRDDYFGNRKPTRSDPRKNFGPQYENKDAMFESGSNSSNQYRDPRLGSANTAGLSASENRRTSTSRSVDNYDGDWDVDEDMNSNQADNGKDEQVYAPVVHQDVIPIVIREPSPPPKYQRASIYDGSTIDNDDEDDADSRGADDDDREYAGDRDMRMPSFLESGDIDLRLPFKPVMTNYTPATEIDGSIASHSPIPYKVYEVSIPKPDYSEIRRTMTVTEKTLDPRLRRIFCLKEPIIDQYGSDSEMLRSPPHTSASMLLGSLPKPIEPVDKVGVNLSLGGPRMDPRRRKENLELMSPTSLLTKSVGLGSTSSTGLGQNVDIRMLLQKSVWYKNLNSKFKIMVNQQLALVSTELKKFHQDTNPDKVFDMKFLATNQYLQQVLTNLGIFIDGNGQILQLDNENDDLMIGTPASGPAMMLAGAGMMMEGVPPMSMGMDFMRPPQPAGMGPMNSRFMGPAGMMNSFGSRFSGDIRPGLLGVSPPMNPFNPFEGNPQTNQFAGGMYGAPNGADEYGGDHHHHQHQGGNPFDQIPGNDSGGKFYGGMDRSQGGGNRGGNRNFRQGNQRNNASDRWSGGGGSGNQGSGRNNQGRNRNYDNRGGGGGGGDRDGRRGDKQNIQQQQQPQLPPPPSDEQEEETWD